MVRLAVGAVFLHSLLYVSCVILLPSYPTPIFSARSSMLDKYINSVKINWWKSILIYSALVFTIEYHHLLPINKIQASLHCNTAYTHVQRRKHSTWRWWEGRSWSWRVSCGLHRRMFTMGISLRLFLFQCCLLDIFRLLPGLKNIQCCWLHLII